MWYQYLNRSQPYLKNYRRWNMWYNHNNPQHREIKRLKAIWLEHALRRLCKWEAHTRFFIAFCLFPMGFWLAKQKKKFSKPKAPEERK